MDLRKFKILKSILAGTTVYIYKNSSKTKETFCLICSTMFLDTNYIENTQ